jgi:hypothetical protein
LLRDFPADTADAPRLSLCIALDFGTHLEKAYGAVKGADDPEFYLEFGAFV